MELDAEDVAPLRRAGEALAVLGRAEHVLAGRADGEGMDEVEGRVGVDPLGERRLVLPVDRLPTDVRDLQAGRVDRGHLAREQPEALGAAELRGALEEQLQPEADAEDRRPRQGPLGDQPVEPGRPDPLHRPREGTDAGKDQTVGGPDLVGIGGDRRPRPDVLERLLDRAQIAHPVIQDQDQRRRLLCFASGGGLTAVTH
jgi:hypothetical protein